MIIEVPPSLRKGVVIDVLSIKVGGSSEGVDILKLLVVREPADNF